MNFQKIIFKNWELFILSLLAQRNSGAKSSIRSDLHNVFEKYKKGNLLLRKFMLSY